MWNTLLRRRDSRPTSPATKSRRRPDRRRTRLGVEVLEGRETPSLTPVSPTAGYPYNSIVKLIMTFPDNRVFNGSGALIDGFHVLTAGHCMYSAADGGWARSIQVIPEMNGTFQPFGSAWMTYERTYSSFTNYSAGHPGRTATNIRDIGLLTLDRSIGTRTGWMGWGYDDNDNHFAAGRVFNTAGYPASAGYNGQRMYFSGGQIAGLSGDRQAIQFWQSSITAYAGQSGSPVWEYTPSGSRMIYAVFVGGDNTPTSLNFATRITHAIYDDVQRWRQSDAAVGRSTVGFTSFGGLTQPGGFGRTGGAQSADEAGARAAPREAVAAPTGWLSVTVGPSGGSVTLTVTLGSPARRAAGPDEGRPPRTGPNLTGWLAAHNADAHDRLPLAPADPSAGHADDRSADLMESLTVYAVYVG
jgi:V8-like Glu-specific endopeptidase